jgi:hypothetical protein
MNRMGTPALVGHLVLQNSHALSSILTATCPVCFRTLPWTLRYCRSWNIVVQMMWRSLVLDWRVCCSYLHLLRLELKVLDHFLSLLILLIFLMVHQLSFLHGGSLACDVQGHVTSMGLRVGICGYWIGALLVGILDWINLVNFECYSSAPIA